MPRKVYTEVTVRLIIDMDESESVDSVIENMDYEFTSNNDGADIVDMEIRSHEVKDSK